MPSKGPQRKPRIPKLSFTETRGYGWHISYRDPVTGTPKRHCFGIPELERKAEAERMYHDWITKHLHGEPLPPRKGARKPITRTFMQPNILSGSIIEIASGLIESERSRIREDGEARRRGTIARAVFTDRSKQIRDFLDFMNDRHGENAINRMRLSDMSMQDVEAYNEHVVTSGYSASQVSKRMQLVKGIVDRAGRPEHGLQGLTWNWDSRDVRHGKPTQERILPTVEQLKNLLDATDQRGKAFIWLGIGLGFGPKDLSAIRVGQIANKAYDLRRGKTGVERFGTTPPYVWAHVSTYQEAKNKAKGDPLFLTKTGQHLVHARSNAVTLWWRSLRNRTGETPKTLGGFYTLRHLGATEFGNRRGASIGDIKRWLGHSASSNVADVYMKPVSPEYEAVIKWVRKSLKNTKL